MWVIVTCCLLLVSDNPNLKLACLHFQPHNFKLFHIHYFKSMFLGYVWSINYINETYQIYAQEIQYDPAFNHLIEMSPILFWSVLLHWWWKERKMYRFVFLTEA